MSKIKKILFSFLLLSLYLSPSYAGLIEPTLPNSSKSRVEIRSYSVDKSTRDRIVRIEVRNVDYPFEIFQRTDNILEVAPGSELGATAIEYKTDGAGSLFANAGGKYLNNHKQLLFRSPNVVDSSDVFTFDIEYRLCDGTGNTPMNIQNAGSVTNYIIFDLEPAYGSRGDRESKQIEIYAKAEEASVSAKVSTSDNNSNSVTLRNGTFADKSYAKLSIPRRPGHSFEIYQEMQSDVMNQEQFAIKSLRQRVAVKSGDSFMQNFSKLPNVADELKIYQSPKVTDSETELELQFELLNDAAADYAGYYTGRALYIVRWDDMKEDRLELNLNVNIQPVFEIKVKNIGKTQFSKLHITEDGVDVLYNVNIKSNRNKAYSVVQHMEDFLVSETGDEISGNRFTIVQSMDSSLPGSVMFKAPTPVKKGDTVVFNSDIKGSPAAFDVKYHMYSDKRTAGGNYRANIRYSLTEK